MATYVRFWIDTLDFRYTPTGEKCFRFVSKLPQGENATNYIRTIARLGETFIIPDFGFTRETGYLLAYDKKGQRLLCPKNEFPESQKLFEIFWDMAVSFEESLDMGDDKPIE